MASVVVTPACAHFQSPALQQGTLSAFSWFLITRPVSKNWWHQAIGCALPVSQLTLQFSAKLSPGQLANASEILALSTWESFSRTGTNAVDIGKVRIARGVLETNLTMVAEAFWVIWSTFKPSTSLPPASPEGPKTDGSFMQHGPQLYNGNYGVSWGNSGLELIALGANTSFVATNSSYDILATVYLNGCRRMIHKASLQWDMAVVGRQSASPNAQAATGVPVSSVNPGLMRAVGGSRAAEFEAFARDVENPGEAVTPPSFVVFYTTDYAVFSRRNYTASVRMTGARVGGGGVQQW
jgi:chondroitin AC lyase